MDIDTAKDLAKDPNPKESRSGAITLGIMLGAVITLLVAVSIMALQEQLSYALSSTELPDPKREFRDLEKTCWWYDDRPTKHYGLYPGVWICSDGFVMCDSGAKLPVGNSTQEPSDE